MRILHGSIGLVVLVVLTGCRAQVDEENVVSGFAAGNERYVWFTEQFPDLETTVVEYQPPRTLPIKRYCILRSRAALPGGYGLLFSQRLEIDSDGRLVVDATHRAASLRIESPDGKRAVLNEAEFDELLEVDNVDRVLAEIGVDFSQPELDDADLIELVRAGVPDFERMIRDSPDARPRAYLLAEYRSRGRATVEIPVDRQFDVQGTWSFRMAPGGTSVTADSTASYELWESEPADEASQVLEPSAIGWSISITADDYEEFRQADNQAQFAADLWRERNSTIISQ